VKQDRNEGLILRSKQRIIIIVITEILEWPKQQRHHEDHEQTKQSRNERSLLLIVHTSTGILQVQ